MHLPELDYRKVALAVLLVATAAFFAFLLYLLFFRTFIAPVIEQPPATGGGTLPGTGGSGPQVVTGVPTTTVPVTSGGADQLGSSLIARGGITQTPTINRTISDALALNASGDVQYYDRINEKFYRVDARGDIHELTGEVFHNVQKVTWDKMSAKAILEYPDGSNVVYDFTTARQITLPKHWEEFSFSPDSAQIAGKSIGTTPENTWLFVANADGTGARVVEALGENADRVDINWSPNNQMIGTYREAKGFDEQKLFFLGLNQENFKLTLVEGRDVRSIWKPDGAQLIYSAYTSATGFRPELWVVDAQGDAIGNNRHDLGLATWADKCTFGDTKTLYCAVPDSLPEQAGLYEELSYDIPDTVYKINLTNGVKSVVGKPDVAVAIEQLIVTGDQRLLYFTDRKTGRLHTMRLQ